MNLFLILAFLSSSVISFAEANSTSTNLKETVESLSSCGNFVRFDENHVYTGFGPYWTSSTLPRVPRPSYLLVFPLGQSSEFRVNTEDSVIDVLKYEKLNYVLTFSGIEEWDLIQKKKLSVYKSHNLLRALNDEEHPRAFSIYKDKIVIAHGRLGVTIFDLKTKKIIRSIPLALSHRPLESVANGIAVSGNKAYVVLDSYHLVNENEKPPFRGLVVIDLDKESIDFELDGMDPGADSIVADSQIAIVSFYGIPLLKYSLKSLYGNKMPSPITRIGKFPVEGRQNGKASIDENYYFTCFFRVPDQGQGNRPIKGQLVMDRKKLLLD